MLGIVVVSYRSDELTVRFVREELSRIRIPHRSIVVDNGATEAEASSLAARLPEGVLVAAAAENLGFARGNNLGVRRLMEEGPCDAFLFVNNDIHFKTDDVVDRLYACLKAHPEAGVAGPEIVGTDGRRQSPEPYRSLGDRFVRMYLSTPFLSARKKATRFRLDYSEKAVEGPHYKLMGACLMVDADAFLRVGGFDEETFLYAEENILSERMRRIGRICYFYPEVTAVHAHGATISRHFSRSRALQAQFRSMAYYYRRYRHYPRWKTALAALVYYPVTVLTAVRHG